MRNRYLSLRYLEKLGRKEFSYDVDQLGSMTDEELVRLDNKIKKMSYTLAILSCNALICTFGKQSVPVENKEFPVLSSRLYCLSLYSNEGVSKRCILLFV